MAQTMKLKVVSEYRAGALYYAAGSVIEVPVETALWLMRDAPGCFEVADKPKQEPEDEELGKSLDGPPADKMVKSPERKK